MIWSGYGITQAGGNFRVEGDWLGEVWQDEKGNPKNHALYRPGDVFIVDEEGWLVKTDQLSALVLKYESQKTSS